MLIILSKSPMTEGAQVVDDLQISSLVSGKQTSQEQFCVSGERSWLCVSVL